MRQTPMENSSEISNLELSELREGLAKLAKFKFDASDPPEKKAARQLVASRVGRALRELRNALENFDDRNSDIVMSHARRDEQNQPIPMLDDFGAVTGVEIKDMRAFSEDRKPLLREKVQIPTLLGIDYALLEKADIPIDGDLVAQLGDFLSGEPAQFTPIQSAS
jgi:hypothetical protein